MEQAQEGTWTTYPQFLWSDEKNSVQAQKSTFKTKHPAVLGVVREDGDKYPPSSFPREWEAQSQKT